MFRHFLLGCVAAGWIVLGAGALRAETVIHVDDDASVGEDASTWNTAYKYLQDALAAASSGDEIHVAGGTYNPDQDEANADGTGDRYATFQLISSVAIYGGYAGLANRGNPNGRNMELYETNLSGDLAGSDVPDLAAFLACFSGEGEVRNRA